MKKLILIIAGLVLAIIGVVGGGLVAARYHDGPVGIIAGGPFQTGELYLDPEPDWSFARDIQTVEFQLLDPARSRHTWIIEHEGRVYVPSGYMTTTWGRIWKQWPIEAERDGRAILRINGTLYERQLVRIKDGPLLQPLLAKLGAKYMGIPTTADGEVPTTQVSSGYLWLFEMAPRSGLRQ